MPVEIRAVRTAVFRSLLAGYAKTHRALERDIDWLESKLRLAPEQFGERVPQLQHLALPIYKTRCKDSCHNIGASGGWRIYYALKKKSAEVILLYLHHKREYENPRLEHLVQQIERALASGWEDL
jgi:hypothetical protein